MNAHTYTHTYSAMMVKYLRGECGVNEAINNGASYADHLLALKAGGVRLTALKNAGIDLELLGHFLLRENKCKA